MQKHNLSTYKHIRGLSFVCRFVSLVEISFVVGPLFRRNFATILPRPTIGRSEWRVRVVQPVNVWTWVVALRFPFVPTLLSLISTLWVVQPTATCLLAIYEPGSFVFVSLLPDLNASTLCFFSFISPSQACDVIK